MSATTKLNKHSNLKQHSLADINNPKTITTEREEQTSTATSLITLTTFSVDQANKDNFKLFYDGKLLREGASNDFTFINISATNHSNSIQLNFTMLAGLNIIAINERLAKVNTPSNENLQAQINTLTDEVEQVAYVKDVKAANTAGGTFTSGAWQTRTLNTLETSGAPAWVSIGSNKITLQTGIYEVDACAPAYYVNQHKARLRNTTAGSDALIGSSEFSSTGAANTAQTCSLIKGFITVSGATDFEVQHQCSSTYASDGFGLASNFGVSEVYTQVKIKKIG